MYVGKKRALGVLGIVLILSLAAVIAVGSRGGWSRGEPPADPPVIQGLRPQVTAMDGDDLAAAALEGVTAVDSQGQSWPVEVEIHLLTGEAAESCPPGTYRLVYTCRDGETLLASAESVLVVEEADREAPVITGAKDLTVTMGETVSYRAGVTVTDNTDQRVRLQVDASQVDLTKPGEYPVVYSAVDSSGNETSVTVTVTVLEGDGTTLVVTQADVDALADAVLADIITDGMSRKEQTRAVYDYVYSHVKYVGTSDKTNWLIGAYVGFVNGRGDCYNYFACSKALLTRLGIPNVDVWRTGGTSDHYWQLVDVGEGYYHFDACPHPNGYPLVSFLITENEARAYTEMAADVRKNYYVYDYDACPVEPVMGPEVTMTPPAQTEAPAEEPVPTVEPTPTAEPTPAAETAPAQVTAPPAESGGAELELPPEATDSPSPVPEVTPAPTPEPTPAPTPEPSPIPTPEPSPPETAVQP